MEHEGAGDFSSASYVFVATDQSVGYQVSGRRWKR